MMMNKEKIIQVLKESFDSVYCNSCKNDYNEDICDYCHRKAIEWSISDEYAEHIADKIIGVKYE